MAGRRYLSVTRQGHATSGDARIGFQLRLADRALRQRQDPSSLHALRVAPAGGKTPHPTLLRKRRRTKRIDTLSKTRQTTLLQRCVCGKNRPISSLFIQERSMAIMRTALLCRSTSCATCLARQCPILGLSRLPLESWSSRKRCSAGLGASHGEINSLPQALTRRSRFTWPVLIAGLHIPRNGPGRLTALALLGEFG